jgi:magnesium transporter
MNKPKHIGAPPGTLFYTGEQSGPVKITLIQFSEEEFLEKEFYEFSDCLTQLQPKLIKWINVEGVHDVELIARIGQEFDLHPLTLEDIVHIEQRPKFEDYEDYLVTIMKMMMYDTQVQSEQLTLILKEKLVISFQEPQGGDAFDIIRTRLRQAKGRVRKMGADYLFYALMDAVVDWYFNTVEKIGDKLEEVEEEIIHNPGKRSLLAMYRLKREVINLRKQVWPLRDMISNLTRSESAFLTDSTEVFLRDLHDHSTRIIDTVETYRDLLGSMLDIYLSNNANKMNEVMKVLTIMSSIFIPVTFIAGVYGMNFDYMPELKSPYGYATVWVIMLSVMGGLIFYFRKRKWM